MPTPPKASQTGGTAAADTSAQVTSGQSVLAFVEQLDEYVDGLKRELRGYGEPSTVGRDTQQLRVFIENIHRCELQIAQGMGIDWTPPQNTVDRSR